MPLIVLTVALEPSSRTLKMFARSLLIGRLPIFGTFALEVDEDGYSALRKTRLNALREEIETLKEELDEMSDDERKDGEGEDVVEIDAVDDVEEEGQEKDANVEDDDDDDEEEKEEEIGEEEDEGEEDKEDEKEEGDKEEFCEIREFCGSSENTPEHGGDASEAALEEVDKEEIDLAEEDDKENDEKKDDEMVGQERKIRCGRSCQTIWRKARVQVEALESEEKSAKKMKLDEREGEEKKKEKEKDMKNGGDEKDEEKNDEKGAVTGRSIASKRKSLGNASDEYDNNDDGDKKSSKRRDSLVKAAASHMAHKRSSRIRSIPRRVRMSISRKRNDENDIPSALPAKRISSKKKKKDRLPRINKRKKNKWRVNWKKRKKFEGG